MTWHGKLIDGQGYRLLRMENDEAHIGDLKFYIAQLSGDMKYWLTGASLVDERRHPPIGPFDTPELACLTCRLMK